MKFKQSGGYNNTNRELLYAFELILIYAAENNIDSKILLFKNKKKTDTYKNIYLFYHPDKSKFTGSEFDVLKMVEDSVKKSKIDMSMSVGKINDIYRNSVYQYVRNNIMMFLNMGIAEQEILRILLGDIGTVVEFRKTADSFHDSTQKLFNQQKKSMSEENKKLINIFYLLYGNLFEEISSLMHIHTSIAIKSMIKTNIYLKLMEKYWKKKKKKYIGVA